MQQQPRLLDQPDRDDNHHAVNTLQPLHGMHEQWLAGRALSFDEALRLAIPYEAAPAKV